MATQLLIDLIKGAIVGVVIALPLGPVGVLCVRRTLVEGPSYGFVSGLGAATADSLFGVIAGFGLTIVRDFLLGYQDWLGVGGGLFLLVVGIRALTRPPEAELGPVGDEALFAAYVSTFALTITNPITILAFAAIFAQIGVSNGSGYLDTGLLVIGVFLGSLVWWLGLSFGIASLHRRLGSFNLAWLNRISGAVLALSGGGLLTAAGVSLLRRVA
ncbi:MAG TPA: LysE family transporter [Stellaceae bacterium]|nr:LysE family transporter [Stellaceae bacterium]